MGDLHGSIKAGFNKENNLSFKAINSFSIVEFSWFSRDMSFTFNSFNTNFSSIKYRLNEVVMGEVPLSISHVNEVRSNLSIIRTYSGFSRNISLSSSPFKTVGEGLFFRPWVNRQLSSNMDRGIAVGP